MSIGEDRVRVKFNPSADSAVDKIKNKSAELIDLCEGLKSKDARLASLAQIAYEEAAMWAVKAATAIFAFAIFCLVGGPASAADLPVKAPPRFVAPPAATSGVYWIMGMGGEATKIGATPTLGLPASTFAAGGMMIGGFGWATPIGVNRAIAIEGVVNYANTGATQVGASFDNRLSGTQRLLYIGDQSMLTRFLPDLSLTSIFPAAPALPTGVAVCAVGQACNPLVLPYIGAVLHEARNDITMGGFGTKFVRVTYGATVGMKTPLTDGSVIDTFAEITSSSGAHLLGTNLTAREGVTARVGVTWQNAISRN